MKNDELDAATVERCAQYFDKHLSDLWSGDAVASAAALSFPIRRAEEVMGVSGTNGNGTARRRTSSAPQAACTIFALASANYVISTVGDYRPNGPNSDAERIGCDRKV